MKRVTLVSPLDGWALPLSAVCDPVFAQGMAGDGVAIDPIGELLCAPCEGEILRLGQAQHALSLRHWSGIEILLHVGIDTIALQGHGFERLVEVGQVVQAGTPLLRFDLDRIAREAKSAVTPVLIASGAQVLSRVVGRALRIGDALLELEVATSALPTETAPSGLRRRFRVPFDHGLHARPAALLVGALRDLRADVRIYARGREANARSTVALMSLGAQCGDEIEVLGQGADAEAALAALALLLTPVESEPSFAAARIETARPTPPSELRAVVAARGLALGPAVFLHEPELAVAEAGQGAAKEQAALLSARNTVAGRIEGAIAAGDAAQREILTAHLALLQDPELLRSAQSHLHHGKSAGFAWRQALRASADAFAALGDVRMAERAADLRDLERQVLQALLGLDAPRVRALPIDAILIADELLPSQLAALDLNRIAGIAMARGGPTSHVALLAAARGIPTLVAAGADLLLVRDDTMLVLDAECGLLSIAPSANELAAARTQLAQRSARGRVELQEANRPAMTRDGSTIAIHGNLGAQSEVEPALARGAEGCGLLRTEFLFLERRAAPSEDEQAEVYAAMATGFGARPLTIRTLDVGGDKPLAYLPLPREDNPVLGLRGLRVSLRTPALLRAQLRAILRASTHGRLRVMLPMVNELDELRAARAMWEDAGRELGLATLPPLGVMIETPAAALLADQLASEAEFLSIGSNDLSQYVLAIDRSHAELAPRLDALHPAVLRLIAQVVEAGRRRGRSVSVCGGLGSDLDATALLIGLGLRELSALPAIIPRLKQRVRELDLGACESLARQALDCTAAHEVRTLVAATNASSLDVPRQIAGASVRMAAEEGR